MNYIQLFCELLIELKSNVLITEQDFQIHSGLNNRQLKQLERELKLEIHDDIKEFYSQLNAVHINWFVFEEDIPNHLDVNEPIPINGAINIQNLYRGLSVYSSRDKWNKGFGVESLETHHKLAMDSFIPFDFYNPQIAACVGFIKKDSILTNQLAHFDIENKYSILNVSFKEYLKLIIDYKGCMIWRDNFIQNKNANEKQFSFYLEQIFPNLKINE